MTPPIKTRSECISVADFRQILWLPLRCTDDFHSTLVNQPNNWVPQAAAIDGGRRRGEADAIEADEDFYTAYVYFHPYIRRFLFGNDGGKSRDLVTFERVWVFGKAVLDVTLPKGQSRAPADTYTLRFSIDHCRIHYFKLAQVGLLEVAVSFAQIARADSSSKQRALTFADTLGNR